MALHVLGMGSAYLKIAWAVVGAVEVNVMHFLSRAKRPAYRCLDNNNVFKHITLFIRARMMRDKKFFVSLLKNKRLLSARCRTSHGAIFSSLMPIRVGASAMRANADLRLRLWFRRVKLCQVMSAAKPSAKMLLLAPGNATFFCRPAFFSLVDKRPPALPFAVTRTSAKVPLGVWIRLLNSLAAIETFHNFHKAMVSKIPDENHFSIRHGGRA